MCLYMCGENLDRLFQGLLSSKKYCEEEKNSQNLWQKLKWKPQKIYDHENLGQSFTFIHFQSDEV